MGSSLRRLWGYTANDRIIGRNHEYVIAFVKWDARSHLRQDLMNQIARYKNPTNLLKWTMGCWSLTQMSWGIC